MSRKTIIACCIGIGLYIGCSLWPHHSEFDDKGTLEDAMGMEIPNYKVKEYISDPIIDCHGDFSDKIVIEFEEIPSKQFIDSVNQRVVADTLFLSNSSFLCKQLVVSLQATRRFSEGETTFWQHLTQYP